MKSLFNTYRLFCFSTVIISNVLFSACKGGYEQEIGTVPNPSFEESQDNEPVGWREYRFSGKPQYT